MTVSADLLNAIARTRAAIPVAAPAESYPTAHDRYHEAGHVRWMLDQAESWVVAGQNGDKAHRWLGFAQGWLWSRGYATIEDMRAWNRPLGPVAQPGRAPGF